jgi:signal transduction histidine kinase
MLRFQDFHTLSYRILYYANRGFLRSDFLREISKAIMDFSGCDAVELHLIERGKYFRCMTGGPEPTFHIETKSYMDLEMEAGATSRAYDLNGEYPSHARIPLAGNGEQNEKNGLLELKSRQRDFFTAEKLAFYEGLAQILSVALAHRRAQVELRERVKELTCLYGIAQLVERPEVAQDELLQDIVALLPPAWLHPKIAQARIIVDGHSYTTLGFQDGRHQQTANIVVNGERRGVVEVVYTEECPELDEGPFLKEERNLIDAVARELALIIERKKAEEDKIKLQEQLRHADRLATIGQLSAGIAHELNEPLGNILGFAELAKQASGLPQQAEQDLQKIVKASLYAREIIRKLMLFARQMPQQNSHVDLNQIVVEALSFFEVRFAKEGIKLVRALATDLPAIVADAAQLTQVLVNLVVNAIQAMPAGGTLNVQTFADANHVVLVVEDTGIGMSEEVMKQIFVPFFTTKGVGQGTGLGLPVVHGIVSAHDGSIQVQSQIGQGARFEIRLPIKIWKKRDGSIS